MRIAIIGAPGSGRSTLTNLLLMADPETRAFGVWSHFAQEIKLQTPLGRAAEAYIETQRRVPDEIVAEAVWEEIHAGRLAEKFILKGVPGNRRQAELLDTILAETGTTLHAVVYVATPPAICRQRASHRLVCQTCGGGTEQAIFYLDGSCITCGTPVTRRYIDGPNAFEERLRQHRELIGPLVDYYRGSRLITLDGSVEPEKLLPGCLDRLVPMLAEMP
jgi:adenylate kinase